MKNANQSIGRHGEKIAESWLIQKGYALITRNFRTRWGEIDIIAEKNRKLSFIEVKTRISALYGKPYESVNPAKIKKLLRPIKFFLLQRKYKDYKLSVNVISLILNDDFTAKEIKLYENIEIGKLY